MSAWGLLLFIGTEQGEHVRLVRKDISMPRATTVRRVPFYLGPDKEIRPEELDDYERAGGWLQQVKMDGMWCAFTVGNAQSGVSNTLKSRDARTPEITGSAAGDLVELPVPLPEGTILIGELEAASQWSTDQFEKNGYRRLHLFDVIYAGKDLREYTTLERYTMLKAVYETYFTTDLLRARFQLVPCFLDHFRLHYDEWLAAGLEGCVLKRLNAKYATSRLDGKTDAMVRCKRHVTGDFLLIGLGMTPGGKHSKPQRNGIWGLYRDGNLVKVMQTGAPQELLTEANVGLLVGEFKGWQRFKSGALQHPQWVRLRNDKSPLECTG